MNIRKFIGGTSRDALRLVREALGADAVVLSNRTLDDGSVEIVALADSDLAAIAPGAAAANGMPGGAGGTKTPSTVRTPAANPANPTNPYASGMPDVFSSVFGASPEVDAGHDDDAARDADVSIAGMAIAQPAARPAAAAGSAAAADPGVVAGVARGPAPAGAAGVSGNAGVPDVTVTLASADAPAAVGASTGASAAGPVRAASAVAARDTASAPAAAVPPTPVETTAVPRTMAESHPWLIDHARRIASQEAARAQAGAPAADPAPLSGVDAATPEWAREAAEAAKRRAAQRLGQNLDAAGAAPSRDAAQPTPRPSAQDTAQTVSEAIRARIEQVVNETVMSELASMRGMMEEQFAGLMWGERQRRSPVQGVLTKRLFAAGFSAQLVKMMGDRLPDGVTEEAGMEWIQSVLESNLPVLDDEDALMERGGVFALMGPTGVGKTTTTAKLAARCVMRFGASRVALLTTDSYRIGGHEQLRIYGRILGVSVHAVRDAGDLQLALAELRNKHIVLIDTIGMSQRDRAVADQIAMLCGAGRPVQRLLLLAATCHGDTLNEVVQAYRDAPDDAPLAGCVLTKLDEATHLGSALDTVLRYRLPVHYVSTGQRVPENLYVATRRFLIRSAFCVPREHSPFVPHEDDIPALLSALSMRPDAQAPEVRFG